MNLPKFTGETNFLTKFTGVNAGGKISTGENPGKKNSTGDFPPVEIVPPGRYPVGKFPLGRHPVHKNLKIGDIGSTFSVRELENDMKPVVHITKTEFFLVSKNLITLSKNGL